MKKVIKILEGVLITLMILIGLFYILSFGAVSIIINLIVNKNYILLLIISPIWCFYTYNIGKMIWDSFDDF